MQQVDFSPMESVRYTHGCHESEVLSGVLLAKPTLIIDDQRVYSARSTSLSCKMRKKQESFSA
jgi:hypothetical protein